MTRSSLIVNPVPEIALGVGKHDKPMHEMCVMECVAYVAGEPHSDHPACACPVITNYAIVLNDRMPDDVRQRLMPYVVRIVGTRSTREIEQRRGYLAADRAVRVFAPLALEAAGQHEDAARLRALEPVVDRVSACAAAARAARAARASFAADAADAAYAAYAAAVDADAAEAAAYAADAAAEAAYAAADAVRAWDAALGLLDDLIERGAGAGDA